LPIVGLDLAGVETRPTGFCILTGMKVEACLVYEDEKIMSIIKEIKPRIITVDAPLSLPPGRKTLEERTGILLRECDRELLKRGIKFFPITPRSYEKANSTKHAFEMPFGRAELDCAGGLSWRRPRCIGDSEKTERTRGT
jgi:predicted nuclease with RNAse H fold